MANEKIENLNKAYEDLKKQHEKVLFDKDSANDKAKKDLAKQLKQSEEKRAELASKLSEVKIETELLKKESSEKDSRLSELEVTLIEKDASIAKLSS